MHVGEMQFVVSKRHLGQLRCMLKKVAGIHCTLQLRLWPFSALMMQQLTCHVQYALHNWNMLSIVVGEMRPPQREACRQAVMALALEAVLRPALKVCHPMT